MVFGPARQPTCRAALLGAMLVAACGGEQGTPPPIKGAVLGPSFGPDPGSGPPDCSADAPYDLALFDDFELGAATGWYTNNEVCSTCPTSPPDEFCNIKCKAVQPSPSYFADPLPADRIGNGGRCASRFAMHVQAGSFSDFGGQLGVQLGQPFDATRYDGVSFWARMAPGSTQTAKLTVSDKYTDTKYNETLATPFCNPNTDKVNYREGCDKYGAFVVMSPNWRFFRLRFDELRQKGFGKPAPPLDVTGIRSIEIDYGVGSWDFWIDDVAFYRRRSP